VLQQADGLLLDELVHHVAQHSAYGVEALVGLADVRKTGVIKKDLLYYEYSDGLAQLGARLHNAQAQRDNLRSKEEVDDLRGIVLDKGANDSERREAKIFERPAL
jgi:hypothetical protein